jgi:hypothetical protein
MMPSPWLPLRLNFTGMPLPALVTLNALLLIG